MSSSGDAISKPSDTRLHALDLVRGMAAFSVAGAHYCVARGIQPARSEILSALAVEVFFVLSGFVLAPQILLCLKQRRWHITRTFLMRRWMRTIPPYTVALICATLLIPQHVSADFFRYLFYVQNFFGQHNAADYFPVAWSLSVEEWFYVVFPIALIAAVRTGRRRDIVVFCLSFVATIFLLRLLWGDLAIWGPAVRRVVVFRIDSIVFGFLLYLGIPRTSPTPLTVLVPVTVTAFLLSYWAIDATTAGSALGAHAFPFLAATFGAGVIAAAIRLERCCQGPALRYTASFLGSISYSVYLFHTLVLAVMPPVSPITDLSQIAIYISVLMLFGATFYHFFEKPILNGRPRYRVESAL